MNKQSGWALRAGWIVIFGVAVSLGAAPAQASVRSRITAALKGAPKAQPGFVPRVVLKQIARQAAKQQREQLKQGKADEASSLQPKIDAARKALALTPTTYKTDRANAKGTKHSLVAKLRNYFDLRASSRASRGTPLDRVISDANFVETIPGKTVITEKQADPSAPEAAKQTFAAVGVAAKTYDPTGVDVMKVVASGPLPATVRYGHMDNAYWDGERQVNGAGGELFHDFSSVPDVTVHEIGHGVTELLTKGNDGHGLGHQIARAFRNLRNRVLNYHGQSGGINESNSDIGGVVSNQVTASKPIKALKETDWLIGNGLWIDAQNRQRNNEFVALRDMLKPGEAYDDPRYGKDGSIGNVSQMKPGLDVHYLSGIPNRAFAAATMALQGTKFESKLAEETTFPVHVAAVRLLGPDATFQEKANADYKMAKKMFPNDPEIATAFQKGWAACGITVKDSFAARVRAKLTSAFAPAAQAAAKK